MNDSQLESEARKLLPMNFYYGNGVSVAAQYIVAKVLINSQQILEKLELHRIGIQF
jgi:hypothetical protein